MAMTMIAFSQMMLLSKIEVINLKIICSKKKRRKKIYSINMAMKRLENSTDSTPFYKMEVKIT